MTDGWHQENQRYLSLSLLELRGRLEGYRDCSSGNGGAANAGEPDPDPEPDPDLRQRLDDACRSMASPPALEILCRQFNLSNFERDILLLCAGVELESGFLSLLASLRGTRSQPHPTFSLALSVLKDPHWSALSPASPLRHWRLIEVEMGMSLTASPIRIDERVLHYLAGVSHLDERLAGIIAPVEVGCLPEAVPSHRALAEKIAAVWSGTYGASRLPVVQLCGEDSQAKRCIAALSCVILGMNLCSLSARSIPSAVGDLDAMIRLWERESVLSISALFLDCDDLDSADSSPLIRQLADAASFPLIVSGRSKRRGFQGPVVTLDVGRPSQKEQRDLWLKMAGNAASSLDGRLDAILSEFDLSPLEIRNAWAQVSGCPDIGASDADGKDDLSCPKDLEDLLWDSCRCQARRQLDDLAARILPAAGWEDLVLPQSQRRILLDIAAHVRNRAVVFGQWGFSRKVSRGLGISALFSGASGTGKTLAAEVLANELGLDLYRIDLSSVVSKYIGETEKNLKRVFDAAEQGGTILLFDEADALFGRRSEVKDSHDRYANIEISYLLQRMEAYRGLAILTTNMKGSIDPAFMRRIMFSVQFPFPDASQRAEIWRRMFPKDAPIDRLDVDKLSRLGVAGGNIRNIALYAAFLAADEGRPIGMKHLLHAAQVEYAKLEKPLTEAEVGGWT